MEREPPVLVTDYDRRNVTGSGPYQVEVAARLRDVRFPALCARCGQAPDGTLVLEKMFRRTYEDAPTRYLFERVPVPFCRACRTVHETQLRPPDPALLRRLRNRWLLGTLPYWIPLAVITYMLTQFVPALLGAVRGGELVEQLVWLAVVAFFTLLLLMFVRIVLRARHRLIADHDGDPDDHHVRIVPGPLGITCVLPGAPTAVLASVNVSDEEKELFDRHRRTFTFANLDVATAFAAANTDLVWEPNSPRAIRARWARNLVFGVLVLAGVLLWLRDVLGF